MDSFQHTDGRVLRLGKQSPKHDPRTLQFAKYLSPTAAQAPPSQDWYKGVTSWGMLANDNLGDCTIASKFHDLQVAFLNTVGPIEFSDADAIKYYGLWDGYVAGDPSTDQGGIILDVLNSWHKHRLNGHRLFAYTSIDPVHFQHIKKAIQLFGIVDIGIALPISAQQQVGRVWDVVDNPPDPNDVEPGSWGGHDVSVCAYDPEGVTVITWGAMQKMTWPFWRKYVDEAYALILGMTLAGNQTGFTGFSLLKLEADLALVTA